MGSAVLMDEGIEIEPEALADEASALRAVRRALIADAPAEQRLERALAIVDARLSRVDVAPGTAPHARDAAAGRAAIRGVVGESARMREVYDAIRRVSQSQATVLLRGESGTGKELMAKAIHDLGPRAGGPFIRLHCAAVTETLLESELFGHERGAFTGAVETRKGRFELADGGTLFLDEIGDIPLGTQVKLLRVLQERCFERVGGSRAVTVDVRLISATHRDLEAMMRSGAFREDLYYRLNVVPIVVPPLRERQGDIPVLIEHFLARFNRENGRRVRLADDLLSLMGRYEWPGNVRELQNCVERLVVMAHSDHRPLAADSIPASLGAYFADMRRVTPSVRGRGGVAPPASPTLTATVHEIERAQVEEALTRHGWVQAKAARALGLTARQVAYKMKKYGIREP